jgi:PAS domain S-box-containing protein
MNSSDASRESLRDNRLFELIVAHAHVSIALLRGPEFVFEVTNPAYTAIAPGMPMLGRRVSDVFPGAADFVLPRLQRVLESGEPFRVDDQPLTISRSVGAVPETAYFSFTYTRVMDGESAESHSILVMALETTARKNAELERELAATELQLQRRIFDTALSNTPDATYVLNRSGRFVYANRTLLGRMRKSLAEVVGRNFFELGYPAELAIRVHRQIDEVLEKQAPIHGETSLSDTTGEVRQYEYIFVPVFAESGEVDAVAGSTRDITERRQAEARERERQEQAREGARLESLGIMAGGIAHDFNNLLTGILGNASLLACTIGEADRELADQIVLAAERAADLTRQMLAFSGRGRFAIEIVDVNKLVQENLTLLRATLSRSINVNVGLVPEACFVEADRAQMQQVIMNLLINASEAIGNRPGNVSIETLVVNRAEARFSAQVQTDVPAGNYVLLEVRDDGDGMPPETVKRIFDPFFTTKFTGRGLGLAAVLGIIKGHRGDIEVVSRPGQGTTFRILLPASNRPVAAAGILFIEPASAGQTVLIVDDEEIVRNTATAALERQGYRILVAGNGAQAIEKLRADCSIALVILDLTMPVMTGEQAIPIIKEMRPDVPVILSSGFGEAEVLDRLSSGGITDFLQKPYNVAEVISKVNHHLQTTHTEPSA